VQYMLRMLGGVLAALPPDAARRELATIATKLMTAIGDARRCFRWLKGVSPLLALCEGSATRGEARWVEWTLAVGNKVALIGFLTLDHTRWLRQFGVLQGPHGPTGRRAMRWLTAAYAFNLLLWLSRAVHCAEGREWVRQQRGRLMAGAGADETRVAGLDEGGEAAAAELQGHLREARKQAMLVLQSAHLGQLLETHDALVGLLGVLTSASDLQALWKKHGHA